MIDDLIHLLMFILIMLMSINVFKVEIVLLLIMKSIELLMSRDVTTHNTKNAEVVY